MPDVTSTAITHIDYDAPARELAITFITGKRYTYFDVPESVYGRFVTANSKGQFFNEYIRDRYEFDGPQHV
jgi:hypothetical protein